MERGRRQLILGYASVGSLKFAARLLLSTVRPLLGPAQPVIRYIIPYYFSASLVHQNCFVMRSFIAVQLLGLAAALPSGELVEQRDTTAQATNTYDYVIVGGGVTGLIVANRLSEKKKSKSCAKNTFEHC